MINYTIAKEIDEEVLFENLKNYLFEMETFDGEYTNMIEDLPKDVQRLIFTKIGTMMVNYAESEDF